MCRVGGLLLVTLVFSCSHARTGPVRNISRAPIFESVRSIEDENWRRWALETLWAERRAMSQTPLLSGFPNVDLYFKNETASTTRSLKHRVGWSLIFSAVLEGKIKNSTHVIESSSGNTAIAEAYISRLLNLRFTAVASTRIQPEKAEEIKKFGGQLVLVESSERPRTADRLVAESGGYFVNQQANAEKAEDSAESGDFKFESANVFHEIFSQLKFTAPDFFIHSAGGGGTITSVGRYIHRYNLPTRVVLADCEYSLLYDYVKHGYFTAPEEHGHNLYEAAKKWPSIPGISYGSRKDPIAFGKTISVIDEVAKIPNVASLAAERVLQRLRAENGAPIDGGPSTGLHFLASLAYAQRHRGTPEKHTTIVTSIADPVMNYRSTHLNETLVSEMLEGGLPRMHCWEKAIETAIASGDDFLESGKSCQ